MGDRCNIVVRESKPADNSLKAALDGAVVLYSHWGGHEMPEDLKRALDRHQRWNDVSYLARIIFCELIGTDTSGETGFGIAAGCLPDNENPIRVVCTDTQTVTQYNYKLGKSENSWPFASFPGRYA